jgi:hypothetical protein
MGSLQTYDLRCDLFEYSGERFKTGQSELDNHFDNENIFKDMTGTTFTVEVRGAVFHMKDAEDKGDLLDTPKLEARVGEVITFDQSHTSNETHPLRIYTGTSPSNGAPVAASEISVVGTPGNAGAKTVWTPSAIGTWYYIKTTTVGMGDTITISASKDTVSLIDTFADNTVIETLGDNIIDFSQNNPFGEDNF